MSNAIQLEFELIYPTYGVFQEVDENGNDVEYLIGTFSNLEEAIDYAVTLNDNSKRVCHAVYELEEIK